MANFDIEGHISDGKSLEWLAYAEGAETPQDVEAKVRQAAVKKFGIAVIFHRWVSYECSTHQIYDQNRAKR